MINKILKVSLIIMNWPQSFKEKHIIYLNYLNIKNDVNQIQIKSGIENINNATHKTTSHQQSYKKLKAKQYYDKLKAKQYYVEYYNKNKEKLQKKKIENMLKNIIIRMKNIKK